MEEGKLGKAYDLNLLKRLWPYGKPYLRIIFIALLVSVGITIFTLATPYVSKMAIDRYIIASWYKIQADAPEQQAVVEKYAVFFLSGEKEKERFLSHTDARKLDPMDLHVLKTGGALAETYYKISPRRKPPLSWKS